VGIGGAGMSAIAAVLVRMGHEVSGSDLKDGPVLERLRAKGVTVSIGHDARNVIGAQGVAISSSVPSSNVELAAARASGIAIWTRAETLRAITAQRATIAVSGTHGKTTTSSMLALMLVEAKRNPSFLVGGEVNEIGTNAAWDSGEWLVVEADESDGTFLKLDSKIALVTNVEADHLEHYGSLAALEDAFREFLAGAPSGCFICADDPGARRCAPLGARTYGFSPDADWRIEKFTGGRSNIAFDLKSATEDLGRFELPVPGAHNALNAAGAIAVARSLGVEADDLRKALARFAGVARRFEFRGEKHGITFVDDYAHLPTEVRATLAAARRGGWSRIVCVFQPHRFSRVAALSSEFCDAFVDADVVAITAIYSAGETPLPGITAELILDGVFEAHPQAHVLYVPSRNDVVAYLKAVLRPGDCCLTMGAGDLTSLPAELLADTTW
jgi:UDP-N-acetylmuramate--alanine ligase